MKKQVTIIFITCFSILQAIGATTGKIKGKIVDTETGDPLPGVNVVIDGLPLGGATNLDGEYFIINIPVGEHTLVASMVGYETIRKTNAKVLIDRTTTIDFALRVTFLEGEEIVVTAEREKIQTDVSFSQYTLSSDEIVAAPTGVDMRETIAMNVGIDRDLYGHISVRGGEIDETGYFVDGLSGSDQRLGIPVIKVPQSAVQEVQVMTGGFSAEYGEARSGMINIVTKDASPTYTFSIDYRISPATQKHFGPNLYSPDNWWDVGRYLYLEPAPDRDGDGQPDFEGWISYMDRNGGEKTIIGHDGPIGVVSSPEEMLEVWEYRHRAQEYANEPDHFIEGTFGGPIPFTNNKLTFFYSGFYDRTLFAFRFSRPAFVDQTHTLKLNFQLANNMKLRYIGNYGETQSVTYDAQPGRFVDAHYWKNMMDAMDGTAEGHLYNADSRMVLADVFRNIQGLEFEHVINNRSFYELKFQYNRAKYNANPSAWRDSTTVAQIGDVMLNEEPFGFAPNKYKDVLGVHRLGEDKGWRDYTQYETYQIRGDYTNQITTKHQIKTGLKLAINNMYLEYGRWRWSDSRIDDPPEEWTDRDISYIEASAYLQDKIEFEGMIMNIGLRLDAFKSNEKAFTDPWSKYYTKGLNYDSLYYAPGEEPDWKLVFSPRLGISHPITENAKLFFNYGYFYQRGTVENLYTDIRKYTSSLVLMSNPDLNFRKTISYELGVEHNVQDLFTYRLTGYYKDVSNEIDDITMSGTTYPVSYQRQMNNRYRDIQGFEAEVLFRVGNWFTGRVNYDYRLVSGGWYGYSKYFEDPFAKNVLQSPNQSKPKPRPVFRANLTFSTPPAETSDSVFELIFSDMLLSTYFRWESGDWLTYHSENYPGSERNNIQWTSWYNMDLTLTKAFNTLGMRLELYAEVHNLLNSKFIESSGTYWDQSTIGMPAYLELIAEKGMKPGEYDDPEVQELLTKGRDYLLYGPTRQIWFGIRASL
jgi:outer membrane receptor protein involved in Fe transport